RGRGAVARRVGRDVVVAAVAVGLVAVVAHLAAGRVAVAALDGAGGGAAVVAHGVAVVTLFGDGLENVVTADLGDAVRTAAVAAHGVAVVAALAAFHDAVAANRSRSGLRRSREPRGSENRQR